MAQQYSNIPLEKTSNDTLKGFEQYTSPPLELNSSVFAAMKGYFTNHGFGDVSAESITITLMSQAQSDGYNPMQILDSLRGLSNVELSALVSEILNYNRYKSSSLGFAAPITKNLTVSRNVIESNSGSTSVTVKKYNVKALDNNSNIITTIDKTLNSSGFTYVKFIIEANVPDGTKVYWDLENGGYFNNGTTKLTSSETLIYNKLGIVNNGFPLDFLFDNLDLTATSQIIKFNLRIGTPTGRIVATTTFTIIKNVANEVDYIVFDYTWYDGQDLDTATGIYPAIGSSTDKFNRNDNSFVTYFNSEYLDLLTLVSDDTGTAGTESILLNVNNLESAYPDATDVEIDCRANWFGDLLALVGIIPIELKITGYKGGSMVSTSGKWENENPNYTVNLNPGFATVQITAKTFPGNGMARIYYSIVTKQILVLPWNPIWDVVVPVAALTDENEQVLTDENGAALTTE